MSSDGSDRIAPKLREMVDELEHAEEHGSDDTVESKLAEIEGAIDGARHLVRDKRRTQTADTDRGNR